MKRKQMNNKNNNKKKKKKWKKVVLVVILILLIIAGVFGYKVYLNGGGLSGILATVVGHDQDTKKKLGEFRCLILGISTDQDGVLLTDTIIVASYNPNTQKATLLSIPRDSYVGASTANASAYYKLNAVYSWNKDPEDVLDAVNDLTGLNLEYYAIVKTEAFIKLVDAIGGITFDVPIDMNYDDTSQDLFIHLKKGVQKLDGDKAEQLVRFRHNNDGTSYPEDYGNNDIGRMRTQREFIIQVIKQTAKAENIFKIGEILDIAKENVITNIDFNVAKDYIPYAVEFDTSNMYTEALPGYSPNWTTTNNVSIFVVDREATKELVQKLFYDRDLETENIENNSSTSDNNIINNQISENTTTSSEIQATNRVSKADVTLEVLNGSGSTSTMEKVIKELEGAGYNISRAGSTNVTSRTTIIDKNQVSEAILNNIEQVLGKGVVSSTTSSSDTEITTSSKVDITIIIGTDY